MTSSKPCQALYLNLRKQLIEAPHSGYNYDLEVGLTCTENPLISATILAVFSLNKRIHSKIIFASMLHFQNNKHTFATLLHLQLFKSFWKINL